MEESELPKGRKGRGVHRSPEEMETDNVFVSRLFLRGYGYREIASMLNDTNKTLGRDYTLSHTQVFKDCRKMLVEWKKERFDNAEEYIVKELRQLDKMESELWDAWDRSKAVKKRTKITGSAKGLKGKTRGVNEKAYMKNVKSYEETEEQMIGNVAYLDLLLNVQQRKAKLLGYEAPVKVEVNQKHEGIVGNVTYSADSITPDMLFKMADLVQNNTFDQIQANKGKASD